jgi:hypothetical protein
MKKQVFFLLLPGFSKPGSCADPTRVSAFEGDPARSSSCSVSSGVLTTSTARARTSTAAGPAEADDLMVLCAPS